MKRRKYTPVPIDRDPVDVDDLDGDLHVDIHISAGPRSGVDNDVRSLELESSASVYAQRRAYL